MNASKRWAYHFVANLECIKCRSKDGRILVDHQGTPIESSFLTLAELHAMIPTMDVLCSTCLHQPMTTSLQKRLVAEGRQAHKRQAALMADAQRYKGIAPEYDEYVTLYGTLTRKQAYKLGSRYQDILYGNL